jgi:hypothetical protein
MLLHDDDVRATSERPGRVRRAQIVEGDFLLDLRGFDRGAQNFVRKLFRDSGVSALDVNSSPVSSTSASFWLA